jgi:hypothetical protein
MRVRTSSAVLSEAVGSHALDDLLHERRVLDRPQHDALAPSAAADPRRLGSRRDQ